VAFIIDCLIQWLVACDGLFRLDLRGGWLDLAERDEAGHFRFLEDFLAVELGHAGVFGVLLDLRVARPDLLLAGVLGDTGLLEGIVGSGVDVSLVQHQIILLLLLDTDLLAACEDLVTAMLLVPLGEGSGHVHLLDDVAPPYAGVVGAEADLAFLRGVGDDALLGAAEVVVEEVLEPHSGDEEEVPAVAAALLDVFHGAVSGHLAVVAAGGAEALVELLQQVDDLEVRGSVRGVVVAQKRERDADDGEELAAGGVVDAGDVLGELHGVEERGDGNGFLGLLVDHQRHADAAVRVASAGELAPLVVRSVYEVGPVGEGGHEGDGEPVAGALTEASLVADVVREVRQGVALRCAALVRNLFVAAGEGHGLEGEEVDLLGVVERELDDTADLLVVDAVDDRRYGNDVDAGLVQVVDGLELHVERIADLAVRVGGVADTVELQVGVAQTGLSGSLGELLGLRELDAVGRGLHGVVTDLAGVGDGVEEVGAERGLATGELNAHLTTRLDGDRVVEHGLDLVPRKLVDEADLVGVHEAGVAHHVAAVGQVDGQNRATAMGDGRGAVVVELLIVVGADVAAGEDIFEVLHHRRVDGHDVLEVAVDGAILDHQDLAVALDDLSLDFADLLVEEDLVGQLAVDDLLANLRDALGAEGVGGTGPA